MMCELYFVITLTKINILPLFGIVSSSEAVVTVLKYCVGIMITKLLILDFC